jgi:non-ribosomal peptide synthetase-like protein
MTARVAWTVVTIVAVETIVCGVALLPLIVVWSQLGSWAPAAPLTRVLAISLAVVPSYVLFALLLMLISAVALRVLGWQTPAGLATRVAALEWPLLRWARGMAVAHIARLVGGTLFRGSPVWTAYLRLAGARLGKRVYVNSLAVTDYALLDFGDDVVIGDGVHLSGHTIEGGVLKTGVVRLGRGVTVGVGSVIGIDVAAGDRCQIGALSLVPKHARLDPDRVYIGIPVRRMVERGSDDADALAG